LELKAEERASTWVGQNSTQKEQPLQRSTLMATKPFGTGTLHEAVGFYASKLHAIEDIEDPNRRYSKNQSFQADGIWSPTESPRPN
jgi:hypothetical protein